jgi:hypothetical protein
VGDGQDVVRVRGVIQAAISGVASSNGF